MLHEGGGIVEAAGKYILSVITAALIVGILGDLTSKKGSAGQLFRLLGGLFLAYTIITPVTNFNFSKVEDFLNDYSLEGMRYSTAGEAEADAMCCAVIKSEVEAYILDKADALKADVQADVMLGEVTLTPVSVQIRGSVSPYAKTQLSNMIESDLGIPKENQTWIG